MSTRNASEEVRRSVPAIPPRENLVRAQPGIELRAAGEGMPTMVGHAAVFNTWTEIRSAYEGNFMERIAPGAFAKTISENRQRIKVLFQHGRDPQIGDKPLGPIAALEEDNTGLRYEVPLLDTSYNRDLLPGLQNNLYGASFRFSVMSEDYVQRPKKTGQNPRGIPERTVRELKMAEFGPVTFGAYPEATSGIRSMTDDYMRSLLGIDHEPTGISLAGIQTPFERADAGDIYCLSQMLNLGAGYLADQDEADDAADIKAMTSVMHTLASLIDGEIDENEPDEPADMMYSQDPEGDERAQWTTEYVDNLPDSSFLYIEDGGSKDGDGKTTPRSLRHFPYKDSSGNVDLPHLRNALARIPDSSLPQSVKDELTAKAQKILAAENGREHEPDASGRTTQQPGLESEPSEATTRSDWRDLLWFASKP